MSEGVCVCVCVSSWDRIPTVYLFSFVYLLFGLYALLLHIIVCGEWRGILVSYKDRCMREDSAGRCKQHTIAHDIHERCDAVLRLCARYS